MSLDAPGHAFKTDIGLSGHPTRALRTPRKGYIVLASTHIGQQATWSRITTEGVNIEDTESMKLFSDRGR